MSRKRCKRTVRPLHNPLIVARNNATRLTASEIDDALRLARAAAPRMRQGLASSDDWAVLAGALQMAQAIEARATQRGPWQSPTLHFHEIDAVQLLLELHLFQLQQLSYGEFRRALATAVGRVRSARVNLVVV